LGKKDPAPDSSFVLLQ